ncbi:MAG: hypothetical protein ACREFW_09685 [Rhizomicrobium sp.]
MFQSVRTSWKQNRLGLAGSLLLHLLVVLIFLWWGLYHPVLHRPPLKAMLVDLVVAPQPSAGPAGGSSAPFRARIPTAPRIEGVKPKAAVPPPDEMEARIARLALLRAPDTAFPAPDNGSADGNGSGGGYTLADFVREQILKRWWPRLDSQARRGVPVAITLKLSASGMISDVRIVDQDRFINDKLFRDMALSARNAALMASPIRLPPGQYARVMTIAITLDPRAVLR